MFASTYDAGASIVGFSNLATFLKNTAPYRRLPESPSMAIPRRTRRRFKKLAHHLRGPGEGAAGS